MDYILGRHYRMGPRYALSIVAIWEGNQMKCGDDRKEHCIDEPAETRQQLRRDLGGTRKSPVPGKRRILVMDDEEVIRQLLHDELIDIGYEVELASDGIQAVAMYHKARESRRPFNAVILDLMVPGGIGGQEAIRRLLQIDPNVKAIISSGYTAHPVMVNFRQYGFKGVLAKPHTTCKLAEKLRRVIEGTDE